MAADILRLVDGTVDLAHQTVIREGGTSRLTTIEARLLAYLVEPGESDSAAGEPPAGAIPRGLTLPRCDRSEVQTVSLSPCMAVRNAGRVPSISSSGAP